jgi:hypothetical protein
MIPEINSHWIENFTNQEVVLLGKVKISSAVEGRWLEGFLYLNVEEIFFDEEYKSYRVRVVEDFYKKFKEIM